MEQIKEKIGNRKGKEKRDDFECVTTFYSFFWSCSPVTKIDFMLLNIS